MNVGVIGAGSMGHGIAQVSAVAGHDVVMRDIDNSIVREGIEHIEANLSGGVEREKLTREDADAALDRIAGTTSLEDAARDADLVIEAVPEEMALKKETFEALDAHAPADCVLATNTSSLSVTEIVSVLEDPSRALGLHFFNPAHIMPLVEIVVAEQTADETVEFGQSYVDDIEKTATVAKDFPGFASSRLGSMYTVEAVQMVQEGVASVEDIDETMRLGYNHPMGPLELADHTGIDVNLEVMQYLREEIGERFKPPQLLKQKVRAGKLGRKTGEGFYVWEDGEIVGVSGK